MSRTLSNINGQTVIPQPHNRFDEVRVFTSKSEQSKYESDRLGQGLVALLTLISSNELRHTTYGIKLVAKS